MRVIGYLVILAGYVYGGAALLIGSYQATQGQPINLAVGGAGLLAVTTMFGRWFFRHEKPDDAPPKD